MELNSTQLATLKAAIAAETNAGFVASRTAGSTGAMADFYNTNAPGPVKVWVKNQTPAATDESADWTLFDAIAAGKRESWGFFLAYSRDYSRNAIRKWVTDVWGNATAGSGAEKILQGALRNARRGELLFGSTDRTTGTVTAGDLTAEGEITNDNIVKALAS